MTSQGDMEVVGPFRGQWAFLSNFFPAVVELDGVPYPTVEHAFQAAKTMRQASRAQIRQAATPGQAKRLARGFEARPDWDDVKDGVMLDLLRQKFRWPELARRLSATGDRPIVEINNWGDTYWGMSGGVGENRLGILLQLLRDELRQGMS